MNYSNGKKPTPKDAVFHRSSSTGLLHACTVLRVEKDGKLTLREAGAKDPLPEPVAASTCILQADHNADAPMPEASPLHQLEKDTTGNPAAAPAAATPPATETSPSGDGSNSNPNPPAP